MPQEPDLPFVCPACGGRFGTGPAKIVLSVFIPVLRFDENLPCCGVRAKGWVSLDPDGRMVIDTITTTREDQPCL